MSPSSALLLLSTILNNPCITCDSSVSMLHLNNRGKTTTSFTPRLSTSLKGFQGVNHSPFSSFPWFNIVPVELEWYGDWSESAPSSVATGGVDPGLRRRWGRR